MTLDARKKSVLMAIVQDYIATAEPVGSRTIARKYKLGVSPATIRNEMADLEEMGYIEQPHTSAGRVPSDQGYRYYVDHLMKREEFNFDEAKLLLNGYLTKKQEVGHVLRSAGQLLSQITNYAGVVMSTHFGRGRFKHIQLVHMGEGQSMVVVVTDSGAVHHRIIDIPESIRAADLETISSVLNHKLQGKTIENIRLTLIKEIYFELAKQKHILNMAMDVIQEGLSLETGEKIYLGSLFNILNQPEFHSIEKVKVLLGLLENEHELANIMSDVFQEEGVTVRIGEEIMDDRLRDYSLVMGTYRMKGKPVGSIGLLGPTRMDYARAFAVVEYMTENLSLVMERLMRWRGK
ncbi:heat-inducible transcriptional repressor HrcA [Desulfallas thermosapovorans]|uniref:Heat-inducible transcription repressor HrcA n=1 Tax=Desulfallas thermosapovorans DSM 6562 TaxID=1121431 RepID=A0A5S4ZW56_9FIRM|nr:heat-inducible transcriptional repressor HrcA [Desulfallas thermosapovorans]TYO97245.1 heat-inducible transcription repressor HrcA [Desulfallas thermosapovorans DSM 6562]